MAETHADAQVQVVSYAVADGVAWIRLNRPESMNAVNGALRRALANAIRQAERDEDVKVVVLTGEGSEFCSGADVLEFPSRGATVDEIMRDDQALLGRLHMMPKPTIAAINGPAAGIGVSLALACDLRFAVPQASFVEPSAKIGLTVDGGASWLLPRLIGTARALEMFYTGDPLGAEEALALGAVNRVVEPDLLEPTVRELAGRLAAGPTMALGAMKRSVNFAAGATFDEAMEFESHLQGVQIQGEDFREGLSARLEKRQARFRGR